MLRRMTSLRPTLIAAPSVLAVATGAALAQPKPAPVPKDTQAKYEPPSGPGAGQAFLRQFEGEWTVERNFYPPDGGAAKKASGECTQKMVQDVQLRTICALRSTPLAPTWGFPASRCRASQRAPGRSYFTA